MTRLHRPTEFRKLLFQQTNGDGKPPEPIGKIFVNDQMRSRKLLGRRHFESQ